MKEFLDQLNAQQKSGKVHPYTCDRRSCNCEVRKNPDEYSKDGTLIATEAGWICPCGDYTQVIAGVSLIGSC